MPQVWQNPNTNEIVRFANLACIDDFIIAFLCKSFKNMNEVKLTIDTLREILYLYRTQGNLSALVGLINTFPISQLKQIATLVNTYEDLTLTVMNQTINSLRNGLLSLVKQLGIWKDLPKYEGFATCPGLQMLMQPINDIFIELSEGIEFLQFQYNAKKRFIQGIGQKQIVNTDFFNALINILDYMSDRINVLCSPFLV